MIVSDRCELKSDASHSIGNRDGRSNNSGLHTGNLAKLHFKVKFSKQPGSEAGGERPSFVTTGR